MDLRQHLKGVAHRLRREGAAHQQSHIQGLRQLGVAATQVEDLLDAMLNSVKAIL